ncbi:hypothetical protein HDU67_000120 [Dinochytrium kinnereticum]|nr:hypothetical protein HDU67_000120 [Dinochytrium kinnereticum]
MRDPKTMTAKEIMEANLRVFEDAELPEGLEVKQPFIHALHTVLLPDQPDPKEPLEANPPKISELKFVQGAQSDQPLISEWSKRMLGGVGGECEPGQLTDTGKLNLLQLGRDLRDHYVGKLGFLPEHLNEHFKDEGMYVRSTGYVRTIESVQYLLAGLFPLECREPGKGGDVAVHVRAVGNMFPTLDTCPRLGEMFRDFRKSAVTSETHNTLARNLATRLGPYILRKKRISKTSPPSQEPPSVSTPPDIVDFGEILHSYDLASCHLAAGLGLPPGIDVGLYRDLEEYVTRYWWDIFSPGRKEFPEPGPGVAGGFGGVSWGEEVRKLAIGRFVGDLGEMMGAAVVGKKEGWWGEREVPKLAIFSGHDTTLGPLLSSLGIFSGANRHIPDFRANLAVELMSRPRRLSWVSQTLGWIGGGKEVTEDHFVRVRYNGRPVRLPGCSGMGSHYLGDPTVCTFEAFKKVMEKELCLGDPTVFIHCPFEEVIEKVMPKQFEEEYWPKRLHAFCCP